MSESKINHSLENLGRGKHRLFIEMDASLVQAEISGRLGKSDLSDAVAPDSLLGDTKDDVINDLVRTSFEDAVLTYSLTPASAPEIEILTDDSQSFSYSAVFDVSPKIDLSVLPSVNLSVPVVEVTSHDLEATAASLLSQSPDKNAVFASFGITAGGEDAFKREVLLNLQREADLCESELKKQSVMNSLGEAYNMEIPESMIGAEMDRLKAELAGADADDSMLRLTATGNLQRRILINAVVQETHLSLHPKTVREHIEKLATAYENPQEVVQYFYGNRVELAGIEAKVIEDLVIDWLIGQCQQTPCKISFSDAVSSLKQ